MLVASGDEVTVFDRFSGEPVPQVPASVRPIVGEFLNLADLAEALTGQDRVFHFLSTTTPASAESDPLIDLRTNANQTVELLRLCVDEGISSFYFASSGGAIYGDQHLEKYSEQDLTLPVSPYGIGKLTIENYLGYFRVKYGLDSVSLRISNPYGPGQHPHRRQGLIPILLARVKAGLAVTRVGDGSMIRDYVFIDDLARMVCAIADGVPRQHVYNLGSGIGHSVNEVLRMVETVTGRELDIRDVPKPPTFVDRVVLDTGRFTDEFGTVANMPLLEGVRQTWDEMRRSNG